jgi:hypothetical protein
MATKATEVEENAVDGGNTEVAEEKTKANAGGVSGPPELISLIKAAADEKHIPARQFVREVVAAAVGFKGELKVQTRQVFGSEEEKKAHRQAVNKEKRELYKALLGKYTPEELQALIAEKEAATA